jgi:N-acetyl-anhydromuramyl-L-alanine amidase AmpD
VPSINMQGIFKAIIDKGARKSYYQEMAINLVEKNYKNVLHNQNGFDAVILKTELLTDAGEIFTSVEDTETSLNLQSPSIWRAYVRPLDIHDLIVPEPCSFQDTSSRQFCLSLHPIALSETVMEDGVQNHQCNPGDIVRCTFLKGPDNPAGMKGLRFNPQRVGRISDQKAEQLYACKEGQQLVDFSGTGSSAASNPSRPAQRITPKKEHNSEPPSANDSEKKAEMKFSSGPDCPFAGHGPIPYPGSYLDYRPLPISRIIIHSTAGWPAGPKEEGWRHSKKGAQQAIFGLAKENKNLRACKYKTADGKTVHGKGNYDKWVRDKAAGAKITNPAKAKAAKKCKNYDGNLYFRNNSSYHYCLDQHGEIWQGAPESYVTWHGAPSGKNRDGKKGGSGASKTLPDKLIGNCGVNRLKTYNYNSVGIEVKGMPQVRKKIHERMGGICPGPRSAKPIKGGPSKYAEMYTEKTVDALARLCVDIATRNGFPPDRKHIHGHDEVSGFQGKTDPGSAYWTASHNKRYDGFDWEDFMDRCEQYYGQTLDRNLGGGDTKIPLRGSKPDKKSAEYKAWKNAGRPASWKTA